MEERALAEDKGHVFTAVLSREESDGIIAFLEREGAAHWRTQGHGDSASEERRYRNYSRQCFFSTELGDLLEKRMGGQLLPESMMADAQAQPLGALGMLSPGRDFGGRGLRSSCTCVRLR